MLSRPRNGWTLFQIGESKEYPLSDVFDDIAFTWTEQAILGLESRCAFCVSGFTEPFEVYCTVSDFYCFIITDEEEDEEISDDYIDGDEYSMQVIHIKKEDFCRALVEDLERYFWEWLEFGRESSNRFEGDRYNELRRRIQRIKELIE